MSSVYLNGVLVAAAEAKVSIFDHAVVTGDGVFETVLVHDKRLFALGRHLERLERSAAVLGLEVTPQVRTELEQAAHAVVSDLGLPDAKVRITLTPGPGPLGSARGDGPPTVIVAGEGIDPPGGGGMSAPAVAAVAPWPRNERGALAGAKTISYAENVVALAWARRQGATEALFQNLVGNLCEGTGSNVFAAHGGELVTPPLSAGCLAGVTRALLLESCDVVERDIPMSEVPELTEAFLCSTTRGVQPIARIDGRDLAECGGPLTRHAAECYESLLASGAER